MVESPEDCPTAADREWAVRVAQAAVAGGAADGVSDEWGIVNTLGVALLRAGRPEDALTELLRAEQMSRVDVPGGFWENRLFVALALEQLRRPEAARALAEAVAAGGVPAERLAEAEPILRRLVDQTREERGAGHADTRRFLGRLALVHGDVLDDPVGTEPLLRELLAVTPVTAPTTPSDGKDDSATPAADVRLRLAAVLCRQGQFAEAESLGTEAVAIARAARPPDPVTLSAALATAGEALLGAGDADHAAAAEEVLRECVDLRRRDAPYAWQTHDAASLLGEALLLQRRFAEAEPVLTDAALRIQPPAYVLRRRVEAVGRVVRLYEQWEAAAPGHGYGALAKRWKAAAPGG
jgi:tetratricopeptide (TPR) repeat protein